MPSSVFSRAKSGYRSRYSSNRVKRGMQGSSATAASGTRLQDAIDPGGSAVDHLGLLPDLDRVRNHQQRVQELQQALGVGGQRVERKTVAVGDGLLGAREERVVERLQL